LKGDYPSGAAFFVDDGKPHTIQQLIAPMAKAFGKEPKIIYLPSWVFRPLASAAYWVCTAFGKEAVITPSKIKELLCPHWVCESQKTQEILQWKPQIALEEGIGETARWYKQKGGI
jgi:nucleoside-diphosphate-sugar epimerase